MAAKVEGTAPVLILLPMSSIEKVSQHIWPNKMKDTVLFKDRTQAGYELASLLKDFKGTETVVLAIPRGGVPLGAIVAKTLELPLDIVLVKKIGHPTNKEYAIGAVSKNQRVLGENAFSVDKTYIENETKRIRKMLGKREKMFHRKKKALSVKGKKVILIDDGIATGNTMLATIQLIRQEQCSEIILAIPVAPASSINMLSESNLIDKIVCPYQPVHFFGIGQFYEDFGQISDDEAIKILEET